MGEIHTIGYPPNTPLQTTPLTPREVQKYIHYNVVYSNQNFVMYPIHQDHRNRIPCVISEDFRMAILYRQKPRRKRPEVHPNTFKNTPRTTLILTTHIVTTASSTSPHFSPHLTNLLTEPYHTLPYLTQPNPTLPNLTCPYLT